MDDKKAKQLQKYKDKLAANVAESKRQMQFAGERFGVFKELERLEKQRERLEDKIFELEESEDFPDNSPVLE